MIHGFGVEIQHVLRHGFRAEVAFRPSPSPGRAHFSQRFIAQQPPLERALLLLYLDDRPQREIADILGITESNVSTKIGRLKQRIRDEL